MKIEDSKDECRVTFSSIVDFKRYIESDTTKYADYLFQSHNGTYSFTGTKTWDDFIYILENGSNEIINKVKSGVDLRVKELEHIYAKTNDYFMDVNGDFFDIGMVMTGEPESWLSRDYYKDKKLVDISVNSSFASGVKSSEIIKNAIEIISIVKALEENDVAVRLIMNYRSEDVNKNIEKKAYCFSMVAKEYEQGLDFIKLSSLLHTSFFRRGIFRCREILLKTNLMEGYGNTSPYDNDILISDMSSIEKFRKKVLE